jgi:hypothetical protein
MTDTWIIEYKKKRRLIFKWRSGDDGYLKDIHVFVNEDDWEDISHDLAANNWLGKIMIGWELYDKKEYRFSEECDWKEWSIKDFMYSQNGKVIELLERREKVKRWRVGKWFESIGEIRRYIERLMENGDI